MSELAIIEIAPDLAPSIYVENGLDKFLEQIREGVNEVPDLSTAKGRARIASLAAQVSRSKTAVEKPGRDYLKRLKEQPKVVEAELRRFVTECDQLRDEVRRPLTEWEAEQERIKAEEAMNALHAEAMEMNEEFDLQRAAQIEADHEMALLMNDKFDRDREEQRRQAEQAQRERDERLKQEAADKAKREAEERHKAELDAAARREAEEKARADAAERKRKEDADRAEREKQDAIAEEKRKAQEEADRIKREAEAKEKARLAEEKHKAEEEARRAADKEHRRTINRQAIADLIESGLPQEMAEKALIAIASGKVSAVSIKY